MDNKDKLHEINRKLTNVQPVIETIYEIAFQMEVNATTSTDKGIAWLPLDDKLINEFARISAKIYGNIAYLEALNDEDFADARKTVKSFIDAILQADSTVDTQCVFEAFGDAYESVLDDLCGYSEALRESIKELTT